MHPGNIISLLWVRASVADRKVLFYILAECCSDIISSGIISFFTIHGEVSGLFSCNADSKPCHLGLEQVLGVGRACNIYGLHRGWHRLCSVPVDLTECCLMEVKCCPLTLRVLTSPYCPPTHTLPSHFHPSHLISFFSFHIPNFILVLLPPYVSG